MGGEHWLFGYTPKRHRQNLGKSWSSFGREMVQIIRPNAVAELWHLQTPIRSVSQQGNVSCRVPKKTAVEQPKL